MENKDKMKKAISVFLCIFLICFLSSCITGQTFVKDRQLQLSGRIYSESDDGGVERWYAIDKYNYFDFSNEIRFQVGYFKETEMGFILYGNGTEGVKAHFSRDGLDLRWDWGLKRGEYLYSFVIQPDGTGLYYDFSTSRNGTAKPREIYETHKF